MFKSDAVLEWYLLTSYLVFIRTFATTLVKNFLKREIANNFILIWLRLIMESSKGKSLESEI